MKAWWKSRTLWFNLIMAGLTTAEASTGMLQAVLPANAYGVLCFVLAVGNAMLRIVSSQALAAK